MKQKTCKRAESTYWLPRVKANLAIDRLRQGDLNVGGDLQDALNMALERQQQMHATRCLEGLAELALARGEPERALGYADHLRELAQTGGLREMLAQSSRWRGEALTALNQFDEAEAELLRDLREATEIGRLRMAWDTHLALARLYRLRGQADLVVRHESLASEISHRIARALPEEISRAGWVH
jgi:tetratricopeptide (TPR) repeat protein